MVRAMTLDQVLDDALRLHNAGTMEAADRAYMSAINRFPDSAEARFRRGILHLGAGRFATAATLFRQALALAPEARFYLCLGTALERDGRIQAARAAYREAIGFAAAGPAPELADAQFGLGCCNYLLGQIEGAIAAYGAAVAARPGFSAAWYNLGVALNALKRPHEAAEAFRGAVRADPDNAEAWVNLAFALKNIGQPQAALLACEEARARGLTHPALLLNQGSALHGLYRYEEAIETLTAAMQAAPDQADTYVSLAGVLHDCGQHERAIEVASRALDLTPDYAPALLNRGLALHALGRLEEAIADRRAVLRRIPDHADAHFDLASSLLISGRLREGWEEHEWRWQRPPMMPRDFSQKLWRGEAIAGQTILLHAEQAYGDTLQFVRYAPMVAALGARVVLEVPTALTRLFSCLPGLAAVIAQGAALPDFDLHCPLLSLPLAFGTTLATVPAEIPYLSADPALVAKWQGRLPAAEGSLRVGLVWAGEPRPEMIEAHRIDRRRSMKLADFSPLAAIPGVRFISLQKGSPAAQVAAPPAGMTIFDPMPEVMDFADTAAIIAGLDLVIAVDTSVAHLAGALGKPVWLLSRFDGCWRWLRERRDSPWYPSLRLYRQENPGAWGAPIAAITEDLRRLAQGSTARAA